MDFEWDTDNLWHVEHEAAYKISPALVDEVGSVDPVIVENEPGLGRSGSHKMIGPNRAGRFWSIILLHRYDDVWRPITGWPSSNNEVRIHQEAENDDG